MLARSFCSILTLGLLGVYSIGAAQTQVSGGQVIANNTPKFGAGTKDLGSADPSAAINVSVWLNVHNRPQFDALAESLYDPKSSNFRHWLSNKEFAAEYAPTEAEAKTVQDFLTANKLSVVTVGPDNLFVSATGTIANVQKAFNVAIHQFEVGGQTVRGNTSDPRVTGPAGALVGAVYGLDNLQFTHPFLTTTSGGAKGKTPPGAGLGLKSAASASNNADPAFFTSNCFTGTKTESFTSSSPFADATYTGNGYTDNTEGCGYTPAQIQTAYNLTALYKEGYDGTGQTIVIIDWCGSPTIKSDANAFSARFGLPALTAANFQIINYPAPSTCAGPDAEINLDVEWAHAIAPGAAIDLVVPPSASFADVDEAVVYAAIYQLGNVISGSYGSEELYTSPTILLNENLINEIAAVNGVSTNFSSGDYGDNTLDDPSLNPATVNAPADSPWATAVGGVSLALNSNNTIKFQTGWGNNINPLDDGGFVFDPPNAGSFYAGSGGGPSGFFAKPWYQSKLPGTERQLPDVSWLADPFTGGIIAITEPFQSPPLIYTVIGGTSLSCPMFSALWAIANQEAGVPLGQAAPYLYYMPKGTILDIVPYSSSTNVKGTVTDSGGKTSYSAAYLAAPLEGTTKFYSALWDYPLAQDTTYVLTFGTDSGLTTAVGWDNVTGVGVPNGKAFADYFRP
jgi:subtilase family serine protease